MLHLFGRNTGRLGARSGLRGLVHTVKLSRAISNPSHNGLGKTRKATEPLDLPQLDQKWRTLWKMRASEGSDARKEAAKKMYILPMFPYPSGDLHLGHLRVYTISDVLARFRRMQGYNVMHPIGWDAFGLPAENAAIERGIDPAVWTKSNISKMKSQLEAMNGSWDWDREFATCDPEFYKHTQALFLLLHEHGLAYQAESMVNYDPVDKTVLANEQVDANGFSWRSGAKVEKRLLRQWFLKISQFREELLKDLEYLGEDAAWPERVLQMQKNWLGKSEGARIKFDITGHSEDATVEVFTTRPDTLFGVQYIALASTHPIVKDLATADVELKFFLDTMAALPADSKCGHLLPGIRAVNPLAPQEDTSSLPVYVAPYVLGDYGDGAVMGVPGHDVRDHAFWKFNCPEEPIRTVISPPSSSAPKTPHSTPFLYPGILNDNCGIYAGHTTAQATTKLIEQLRSTEQGSAATSWRLRDWLISRQRYWGTPIPIIHCEDCGAVPVPMDQLPVVLPRVKNHWVGGKTGNPLSDAHDWVNTLCPKCHSPAKRDTDTMDTFVDSSWYFMRFIDPHNQQMIFSPEKAKALLPVDVYIGGVEHAILHLLYARFISKFVASTKLWKSSSNGEPFSKVLTQGMVHGKTFSDASSGRFLKPNEVDLSLPAKPIVIATGESAKVSFEKMSKSKYNGVDPGACMEKYGADATRAHILFQAPVSEVLEWDEAKISGVTRWLKRIHEHLISLKLTPWTGAPTDTTPKNCFFNKEYAEMIEDIRKVIRLQLPVLPRLSEVADEVLRNQMASRVKHFDMDVKLWRLVQSTISKVSQSYAESHALNTVVSDLMGLTNAIIEHHNYRHSTPTRLPTPKGEVIQRHAMMALIQMMAPITPAFSEECWQLLHPPSHEVESVPESIMGKQAPTQQNSTSLKTSTVHSPNNAGQLLSTGTDPPIASVFDFPFPEPDGTLPLLFFSQTTQKCAVMINGKLKFAVDIGFPSNSLAGKELEQWATKEIYETEPGKSHMTDLSKAKKVIVVQKGRTVNFVI